jgi:membrane protease YdiL (CAAX protease family)
MREQPAPHARRAPTTVSILGVAAAPFALLTLAALLTVGPAAVTQRLGPATLYAAVQVLIGAVLVGLAAAATRRLAWPVAVAAIVWVLSILNTLGVPRTGIFADLQRNWQGKLTDLAMIVLLLWAAGPAVRRQAALTTRMTPGSARPVVLTGALITVVYAGLNWLGGTGGIRPTGEELLFQATMPGLAEELLWRGLLLGLLNEVFGQPWRLLGARTGWGLVLVTAAFAAGHGIQLVDGHLTLSGVGLVTSAVLALIFGWMRERSGSVWPAVIAHAAVDAGVVVVAYLTT